MKINSEIKESLVLIGGTKAQFYDLEARILAIFLNAELIWLRSYNEAQVFFMKGYKAKLIFLDSFVAGFSGEFLASEVNKMSNNTPLIFVNQISFGTNPKPDLMNKVDHARKSSAYMYI